MSCMILSRVAPKTSIIGRPILSAPWKQVSPSSKTASGHFKPFVQCWRGNFSQQMRQRFFFSFNKVYGPALKHAKTKLKHGASFALLPSFTLFRWLKPQQEHGDANLSAEILANIPKEVFKKETFKKKKKRHFLIRIFLKIWNSIYLMCRFTRICLTFGPIICLYPCTYLGMPVTRLWWRLLLFAMEITGPTFIKLGQWSSTRRDLFPDEFCDMCSRLHTATRVHGWAQTKRKLQKSFGKQWRDILVKIHKKPIGSGCVAQVHKAYMRADMIPDESLLEEMTLDDEDEPEVDFADGLEILGLGGDKEEGEEVTEVYQTRRHRLLNFLPAAFQRRRHQAGVDGAGGSAAAADGGESAPATPQAAQVEVPSDVSEAYPPPEAGENDEIPLLPVAVKVLHPGVYKSVTMDLKILKALAVLGECMIPSLRWLSLKECVAEFSDLMTRQIDLRFEANCLEQFADNFQDNPNIRFPRPVRPYCKRTVLLETFEEGEMISDYLKDSNELLPEGLRERLAALGVDALLQMIFVDNFVHGDLHPGNILVQNASDYLPQEESKLMLVDICDTVIVNVKEVECPLRLIFLDTGMTATLGDRDLENFKAVFTAVIIGEGDQVAELMLKHSRYNECKDVTAFKKDLSEVVMEARQQTIKLGKIHAGELLSKVFRCLCRHRVKMESNFASVLIAIYVLEGLGRSLDPELDLLARAKPILLS